MLCARVNNVVLSGRPTSLRLHLLCLLANPCKAAKSPQLRALWIGSKILHCIFLDNRVCLLLLVPQIINDYIVLPNPYPDAVVAVINQTAQVIDGSGRAVPLSEVYVVSSHHHQ